jgi:hypothetical protein
LGVRLKLQIMFARNAAKRISDFRRAALVILRMGAD